MISGSKRGREAEAAMAAVVGRYQVETVHFTTPQWNNDLGIPNDHGYYEFSVIYDAEAGDSKKASVFHRQIMEDVTTSKDGLVSSLLPSSESDATSSPDTSPDQVAVKEGGDYRIFQC